MSWVAIGVTGASLIGGAMNGGKSGQQTVPSLTPEQQRMLGMLGQYGETGMLGGKNMEYTGPLGNYDKSAMETTGQNRLLGYATSADPRLGSSFGMGQTALNNLVSGNYFDPMNDGGAYKGYKQNAMRELGQMNANIKRDAAVGGNLYSTNTVNKIGDANAQAMNNLTNKTAELYQNYNNQRIGGISTALNAGLQEGQFNQGNREQGANLAAMALQAGGLDRALADQKAKDAYNNFTANRQSRLGALGTAIKTPAVDTTIPTYSESPWQGLFNKGLDFGLSTFGENYGKTGHFLGKSPVKWQSPADYGGSGLSLNYNPYGRSF